MTRARLLRRLTTPLHRAWVLAAALCVAVACGEGASDGRHEDGGTGGAHLNVPCVDVSHVGALQTRDLRVIGTGFDAYDNLMIRVLVTLGEPEYGLGEAQIERGSFDISLPGVLGDYTGLAIHVDRIRDNACNPDTEILWQATTGPLSALGPSLSIAASGEAVWSVAPDTLRVFEEAGPCNLNGVFDLTISLPCATDGK